MSNFFIIKRKNEYQVINRINGQILELSEDKELKDVTKECKKAYEIDKKENFKNEMGLQLGTKRYLTLLTGDYMYFFLDELILETDDVKEIQQAIDDLKRSN